jgi:hypothetical protein
MKYILPYNITVEVIDKYGSITSTLYKDKNSTKKEAEVIERLILAHACAGIDVSFGDYVEGLKNVLEALAND